MTAEKDYYKQAIEASQFLSIEQRQKLIEELTRQMEAVVKPLPLIGTWEGVSLSEEEIDEARRESWARLGDDE